MKSKGNLTGAQLAPRLNRSPSYVSQLINDKKMETPPPEVLAALERELGLTQAQMLRSLGYAVGEVPAEGGIPEPFERGTPHAKVVELLHELGDEDALMVASFTQWKIDHPKVPVPVIVMEPAGRP